jgi:hypothetical protein
VLMSATFGRKPSRMLTTAIPSATAFNTGRRDC